MSGPSGKKGGFQCRGDLVQSKTTTHGSGMCRNAIPVTALEGKIKTAGCTEFVQKDVAVCHQSAN